MNTYFALRLTGKCFLYFGLKLARNALASLVDNKDQNGSMLVGDIQKTYTIRKNKKIYWLKTNLNAHVERQKQNIKVSI